MLLDLGALPNEEERCMLDACAGLVYGFDASMTPTIPDRYVLEPPRSGGDRLPDDE